MDNSTPTNCKVCNKIFADETEFHKHLRSHKMRQAEYYQKYFPRFDRYDNFIIKFKSKEQYFSTVFNSKKNLKSWLQSVAPDSAKRYIKDYLLKRKNDGKLVFYPSQVELRTMMVPGIKYISDQIGDYNDFCAELGLKRRFSSAKLDESLFADISRKVIFADSREQNPLEFDNTTRTEGLKFGDYRMKGSSVCIERKSIADAWGTLTGGFERFEREIVRAQEAGSYLVVLVEESFESLEKFPSHPQVSGKIKLPVEFVYRNMRILMQKYPHIQFLFTKNRAEASRVIQKLFAADEQVKNVDLQHLLDIGKL